MQLLDVSDFEVRTYATLISLGESNISILSKVMKAEKKDIINILSTLKKRGWIISVDGIYRSVNPTHAIKSEIYKLKRDFEQKINTLESDVLMNLKTLFVQNNFKHINYSEFMDLI